MGKKTGPVHSENMGLNPSRRAIHFHGLFYNVDYLLLGKIVCGLGHICIFITIKWSKGAF